MEANMANASKTPVLIALGSNLGDKRRNLDLACERVAALDGVSEFQKSDWLSTQPVGGPASQEIFLNGAATFTTSRPSVELFHALKNIERQLGRENTLRWGPRLIDIDLLLYGEEMFHDPASDLHVPHPRMAFRHFVLAPAAEVAPDMRHPVIGWTISLLLEHLQTSPPVVVFGLKNQGQANRLAAEVSTESGASILSREQRRDASWDDSLISCV